MYTLPIHEHLRPKLCDLYENDCIFDKFEVAINGSGSYVWLHLRCLKAVPRAACCGLCLEAG